MAPKKPFEFKLRPDKAGNLKEASRIYVRKELIFDITGAVADNGRPCVIERVNGDRDRSRTEAILYASSDPNTAKNIAKISPTFLEASGFTLSDMVQITGLGNQVPDADQIVLEEIPGDVTKESNFPDRDDVAWRYFLAAELHKISNIFPGMILKDITGDDIRSFKVVSVNKRTNSIAQYRPRKTELILSAAVDETAKPRPKLEITGISGLDDAVRQLNEFLLDFDGAHEIPEFESAAVVLHGGSGTGKTMLINHIANIGWGTVHRIKPDDKLSSIREALARAREQQPGMLILDDFHELLDPKERTNRRALIKTLCEFLDNLVREIRDRGTPRVFVLVACPDYTTDMPPELRRPGRMLNEILLPPPDINCRRVILDSIKPPLRAATRDAQLLDWAQRTHAYNGHDLGGVIEVAAKFSSDQHRAHLRNNIVDCDCYLVDGPTQNSNVDSAEHKSTKIRITDSAFSEALVRVRPTAMHDVNLKPPPIQWSDIGGQDSVKLALRNAVRLLNTPREALRLLNLQPPKGVLLYGPPGCSKTMAAQAMATESGLNFFAVKGAELLNSYVGESERAVRALFARVRAAAPAMVFFDEIDAIASSRGSGGSGEKTTTHGGLNVLTTLLNEMDGFEDMKGVLVLAATNRPHALDPALLRPGRFDQIIYVPPPDGPARRAMLTAAVRKMRTHAGVDVEELVKLTDGYSGAEIAGICRGAGMEAWMRDGVEGVVGMEDYTTAIKGTRMMITADMLDGFKKWEERF